MWLHATICWCQVWLHAPSCYRCRRRLKRWVLECIPLGIIDGCVKVYNEFTHIKSSFVPPQVQTQAQEVDSRILSGIIAGVRRAFPFVASDDVQPLIEEHSDALFKMIHTAPFAVAVQALLLLYQLMASQSAVSDRFYRSALPAASVPSSSVSSTVFPNLLSIGNDIVVVHVHCIQLQWQCKHCWSAVPWHGFLRW